MAKIFLRSWSKNELLRTDRFVQFNDLAISESVESTTKNYSIIFLYFCLGLENINCISHTYELSIIGHTATGLSSLLYTWNLLLHMQSIIILNEQQRPRRNCRHIFFFLNCIDLNCARRLKRLHSFIVSIVLIRYYTKYNA